MVKIIFAATFLERNILEIKASSVVGKLIAPSSGEVCRRQRTACLED
jgi:hypothetical protein